LRGHDEGRHDDGCGSNADGGGQLGQTTWHGLLQLRTIPILVSSPFFNDTAQAPICRGADPLVAERHRYDVMLIAPPSW